MPPATAGWQQRADKPQPQIAIHRTVSRPFFSLSPYLWWENNHTTPACWKTYWNGIAFEHGTLCRFFFFIYVTPLMRQLQNNIWGTISRIGGWRTNTKIINTETSLHLNLDFFFLFYYYFLFSSIFFFIYIHFFFPLILFIFILMFILFIF
jgi:hypothetical protein